MKAKEIRKLAGEEATEADRAPYTQTIIGTSGIILMLGEIAAQLAELKLKPPAPALGCKGAQLIVLERMRQISEEGWTPAHDAGHLSAELTNAACAYAETAAMQMYRDVQKPAIGLVPDCWPWHTECWKPSDDPIRNLVKAGALIAAEIDRLDLQRKKEECAAPEGQ